MAMKWVLHQLWFTLQSRLLQWGLLGMNEKMTWMPTWQHFLLGEFSGGQVSWTTSNPRTRNLTSGELQLEAIF
jgi:hypothetical protein